MGQSLGHRHLPGDRLIPFCGFHLNLSLAARRREINQLVTEPLILGVRQYCHGIGVSGDLPHERRRLKSVNWGIVDSLRGDTAPAPRCLAAFSDTGVVVIDGVERVVRAYLDHHLTFEVDVLDAAELHGLCLISRDPAAGTAKPKRLSVPQPILMAATQQGHRQEFVPPPAYRL